MNFAKYIMEFQSISLINLNFTLISISISIRKMYRNLTPTGLLDQTESQHKDTVISSLKKELF